MERPTAPSLGHLCWLRVRGQPSHRPGGTGREMAIPARSPDGSTFNSCCCWGTCFPVSHPSEAQGCPVTGYFTPDLTPGTAPGTEGRRG